MVKAIEELLQRVPHIDISGMSYEEWLEKRRSSIGGSDAGSIMGFNRKYGSPLTVFLQKKGMEKDKETSPAAKRGKLLEPLIRDWFAEEYPDAVIEKMPYMFFSPENKIISANIDGLIYTEKLISMSGDQCIGLGGLEIKSSREGYDFTDDEIPDSYYAQVQHYINVLGLDWFIVSAAILTTEEIKNYLIPRNDEFIFDMVQKETEFWNNHILTGEWPAAIGIENEEDMINSMFEGSSALVLGDEEKELCRIHVEANARFKEAKETKDRVSTDLKAIIIQKQTKKDEKKISAVAGKYNISWSRFPRKDVDTDALKRDGLYDKYAKISESGRMTISEKKGA